MCSGIYSRRCKCREFILIIIVSLWVSVDCFNLRDSFHDALNIDVKSYMKNNLFGNCTAIKGNIEMKENVWIKFVPLGITTLEFLDYICT